MLAVRLAAPVVLVAAVVGLVVSLIQSIFQVGEPSLTFLPKSIAVGLLLLAMGPYIGSVLRDFFFYVLTLAGG